MGWFAVILALVLTGVGILAFKGAGLSTAGATAIPAWEASSAPNLNGSRQKTVLEIAQLDDAHADDTDPTRRASYLKRRGELLARLREEG